MCKYQNHQSKEIWGCCGDCVIQELVECELKKCDKTLYTAICIKDHQDHVGGSNADYLCHRKEDPTTCNWYKARFA
jgi:hypothetical protein